MPNKFEGGLKANEKHVLLNKPHLSVDTVGLDRTKTIGPQRIFVHFQIQVPSHLLKWASYLIHIFYGITSSINSVQCIRLFPKKLKV